jgi:putative methionine-R-sulfoxide reductase with GAF domain
MLKEDLIAERIAIDSYREMINYIGKDDSTTRRMLEGILAVEEEHADDLQSLLETTRPDPSMHTLDLPPTPTTAPRLRRAARQPARPGRGRARPRSPTSPTSTAALNQAIPGVSWVGFYRKLGPDLVLGPFQGKLACTRIARGKGVCGAAAERAATVVVPDVDAFPGHIACDSATRSEIVVPIVRAGQVVAVLDLDSDRLANFAAVDAEHLGQALVAALAVSRSPGLISSPAMIIVTGTKRSGTSMWMQILIAAGFPIIGEAFPMRWEHTIKAANPEGFYESHLRRGIYYRTNPHPKTGAYLFPEQVQHHAVKVFIPGLIRSDRAFIGKVIATVREWREYESSIARLYAIEDESRRAEGKGELIPEERMPGALEWWAENFALVRDIAVRRYPVHVQSYEGLLQRARARHPRRAAWLGKRRRRPALAAVKPEHRTQKRPESTPSSRRSPRSSTPSTPPCTPARASRPRSCRSSTRPTRSWPPASRSSRCACASRTAAAPILRAKLRREQATAGAPVPDDSSRGRRDRRGVEPEPVNHRTPETARAPASPRPRQRHPASSSTLPSTSVTRK